MAVNTEQWQSTVSSLAALFLVVSVSATCQAQTVANGPSRSGIGKYLFAWASDDKGGDSDFMAVVDSDPASSTYGKILATVPVGETGTHAHHTEHRMPQGGILFANGFYAGKTFLFDLNDPLHPKLAGSFTSAGPFNFPHSFERLPNGNVLSTFQRKGEDNHKPGGLVELDPEGRFIRGGSAATEDADFVRPYSLAVLPDRDRAISTTTDMASDTAAWHVQIWRLSDLELLHTIPLPHGPRGNEGLHPGEARVTANGTVVVGTFKCGVYRIDAITSEEPKAVLVESLEYIDGWECALSTVIGDYVVQTVPAIWGLVSIDFSDPANPVEADRIVFGPGMHPHWIASSPDGARIVVSGYRGLSGRLLIVDVDRESGKLTLDERFREENAIIPGVSFRRNNWPHGATRDAIPHGVVFSIE